MKNQWKNYSKLNNPSQEEWFDMWCAELIKTGYIDKVLTQDIKGWEIYPGEHMLYPETKIVGEGSIRERISTKTKKYILHRPVRYTPDRIIFWREEAKDVFFTDIPDIVKGNIKYFLGQEMPNGNYISVVDVKSPFGGKNSSDVSFSIKKKWVWVKEKVYVNQAVMYPIKPLKNTAKYLWPTTFTPKRFLYTDKLQVTKSKPIPYRTIPNKKGIPNWEVRTLVDFI